MSKTESSGLPIDAAERKAIPLCTGVLDYFPNALAAVAECSRVGNEQHNPGQPLHWAKEKSTDEADALLRHLSERGKVDTDGVRHSAKVAWRALALLQREIEAEAPVPNGWVIEDTSCLDPQWRYRDSRYWQRSERQRMGVVPFKTRRAAEIVLQDPIYGLICRVVPTSQMGEWYDANYANCGWLIYDSADGLYRGRDQGTAPVWGTREHAALVPFPSRTEAEQEWAVYPGALTMSVVPA